MTNRVEYVKGERNVADLFSRPVVSAHSDLNSILPNSERFVIDYMEMATEQHNDQEVQNLKNNNVTGLCIEEVLLSDTGLTILCDNSRGRLRPASMSKSRNQTDFSSCSVVRYAARYHSIDERMPTMRTIKSI